MLKRKYAEDIIGDEYMQWAEGDKVVISTPTGSGKTTFIISKLLRYATEQGKHIIYYCNRKVLYEQFQVRSKEDIERFFQSDVEISETAAQYLHILTYQGSELRENYPQVSVKDYASGETVVYGTEDILYYIFDEAHYFVNDAMINYRTNFWYEKKFRYGISVFLTATPKPLLALFEGWNQLTVDSNSILHSEYKLRDKLKERAEEVIPMIADTFLWECKACSRELSVKMPSNKELADAAIRRFSNPLRNWFQALERVYQAENSQNKVYSFDPDYSYVEPVYFESFEELIPEIRKDKDNNEKWLIFVDDEIMGNNLATRITYGEDIPTVFISSSTAKRKGPARDVYNDIVTNQKFPVKVLIATSVLDCGINIESTPEEPVNNIVIVSDNETTFLQMLGRRRVKSNERIRLFIKVFNYQTINNRYNQCTRELRFLLKLSLKNEIKVIRGGRSTAYRDGNTYGSALSANDLDSLIDEFISMKKPALITRVADDIVTDCNGYVKEKQIKQMMNYEAHLMEYEYSKTAFLNLVYRMHDYRRAMSNYRRENKQFVNLCAHAFNCLMLTRTHRIDDGLRSVLSFAPEIERDRFSRFPFLAERKPDISEIDCRSHVERDLEFYLRHQLSWLGKEYDRNCWLGFEGKFAELTRYLDAVVDSGEWLREDDVWHEQHAFSSKCMELMLALPVVPDVLLKDRSRYILHPEKYPAKDKLEKCFGALSLPYTIKTEQRRYGGKRKTCWKLCK